MPNPKKEKNNRSEVDHKGLAEFSGQHEDDAEGSAKMDEQQLKEEENTALDNSTDTGNESSTKGQSKPGCGKESDPGKQDIESSPEQVTESSPKQETESSPEQDTESSPEQDTESSPEQDTESSPEQDTESSPEQETESSPEQDTESSPEQDTESSSEQDTESSSEEDELDKSLAETCYSENVLKAAGIEPSEHLSPRLISIIESLLFVSDKPLPVATLCRVLDEGGTKKIKCALKAIKQIRKGSGINLVEVAGGYQLRTNPENAKWIRKLNPEKPARLSRAALETLAITAYRQPVTRADIDEIRGVDSGGVLRVLLERNLLKILGKKQEPGRPLLYGTSKEFLSFFGLKDLSDLPSLREFRELSEDNKEKLEEEEMERFAAMQEQFMKNTNQEQSNENIFATLAASSKQHDGEHNKTDEEIERAFNQVSDATKKARRVQKELSRVGVLENETEGKKTKENQEASTGEGVSSSGTGSLEDIARRHTEAEKNNPETKVRDGGENNDKNYAENSTPNNETNSIVNSAQNDDDDAE